MTTDIGTPAPPAAAAIGNEEVEKAAVAVAVERPDLGAWMGVAAAVDVPDIGDKPKGWLLRASWPGYGGSAEAD